MSSHHAGQSLSPPEKARVGMHVASHPALRARHRRLVESSIATPSPALRPPPAGTPRPNRRGAQNAQKGNVAVVAPRHQRAIPRRRWERTEVAGIENRHSNAGAIRKAPPPNTPQQRWQALPEGNPPYAWNGAGRRHRRTPASNGSPHVLPSRNKQGFAGIMLASRYVTVIRYGPKKTFACSFRIKHAIHSGFRPVLEEEVRPRSIPETGMARKW